MKTRMNIDLMPVPDKTHSWIWRVQIGESQAALAKCVSIVKTPSATVLARLQAGPLDDADEVYDDEGVAELLSAIFGTMDKEWPGWLKRENYDLCLYLCLPGADENMDGLMLDWYKESRFFGMGE